MIPLTILSVMTESFILCSEDRTPPEKTVQVSDLYNHKVNPLPNLPDHLKFTCGVSDTQGERFEMEDSHALIAPFDGVPGQGFFAVYDGHGGKSIADLCGRKFHEYFQKAMKNESNLTLPILEILKKTFLEVDAEIIKNFDDRQAHDPGSTAVVAFLEEVRNRSAGDGEVETQGLNAIEPVDRDRHRVLYCANAGDSRGVLCRGGKSIPLTEDHRISKENTTEENTTEENTTKENTTEEERIKIIWENEPGEENERGEEKRPIIVNSRIFGGLNVTRSLGDHEFKKYVIAEPYTREEKLGDEDEFVILASDGLWDRVKNEQAVEHVRYTKDPEKAAEELVKLATENDSSDNITVVVIRLRDPPARDCQNPQEPDISN